MSAKTLTNATSPWLCQKNSTREMSCVETKKGSSVLGYGFVGYSVDKKKSAIQKHCQMKTLHYVSIETLFPGRSIPKQTRNTDIVRLIIDGR